MHLPGASEAPTHPFARRPALLASLAIAVVAIALRVWGLGRESLWLDEGYTWRLARMAPLDAIAASRGDVHPPLFVLLVGMLVRIFGDCETTLRAVSVVASCASVLFAWRLARRAWGDTAAWGAATLVALSVFQVRYAQEARAYALLGALSLASADALAASLAGGRARARIAWAVSTAALLYTHASGAFVVFAEAAALAWWMRRPEGRAAARRMLVPAASVVAACLPWAAVLREQVGRVSQSFWIARPGPFEIVRSLYEFAGGFTLMALLGLLAVVGLAMPWSTDRTPPAGHAPDPAGPVAFARVLVVALALIALLVPFAVSLAGPPVYLTRAALPASLALAIVAAAGWAALPSLVRVLMAVLVLAASVPPLLAHHRNTYKEPWREAVGWLEQQARPGDLVLVTAPWYCDGVVAYYSKRHDLDVLRTPLHDGPVGASDIDSLRPVLARHPRAWLVRARADDPQGLLPAALAEGRERTEHREWKVTPVFLTRVRGGVRALEIFCYAAADSSSPPVASRPQRR